MCPAGLGYQMTVHKSTQIATVKRGGVHCLNVHVLISLKAIQGQMG